MRLVDGFGVLHRVLPTRVGHLGPDDVDARVGVDAAAFEVFLPVAVGRPVGVGSRDDDRILRLLRVHRGLEAGAGLLSRDDLLARDVATALRRGLVLDVDGRDARLLVLADGPADVVDAAVARIAVGDDGEVAGFHDSFGVLDHLGHRHHLQVGKPNWPRTVE